MYSDHPPKHSVDVATGLLQNKTIKKKKKKDSLSLLSISFLLSIIASTALWIGNTFYTNTIFEGSFTLCLQSTREEVILVQHHTMSTVSLAAPTYSKSLQEF